MARRKARRGRALEPGRVYIRDEGNDYWQVEWSDGQKRIKGKTNAQEWAARKQRELDDQRKGEIPFGDSAKGMDPTRGEAWLQLLWDACITTAQNPNNDGTRKAGMMIAAGARAARPYIRPADMTDSDMPADEFLEYIGSNIQPVIDQATPEVAKRFLKLVKGGKA